jgi:hypothetical protein
LLTQRTAARGSTLSTSIRLSFPAVAGRDDFIRNRENVIIDNPPPPTTTTTLKKSGGDGLLAHGKSVVLEQH